MICAGLRNYYDQISARVIKFSSIFLNFFSKNNNFIRKYSVFQYYFYIYFVSFKILFARNAI